MPNKLISEQSIYLLQHAHNPVNWHPWGEEAFEEAKASDKPLLISIGYAACHWCHVMERESFEDAEIAAFMNRHFVCIKIDREEHPDVDSYYMDAVQAISGSGGWPLNIFATQEKIPIYGGTYFPPKPAYGRASWGQVLERIADVWSHDREQVSAQAHQMKIYLEKAGAPHFKAADVAAISEQSLKEMTETLISTADTKWGGFGNAPKFPGSMAINFLLQEHQYQPNEKALYIALLSLNKMMEGGIYDQLGGGFSRYSTDERWFAPHFEKMLYDNALLLISYCDACKISKNEDFKKAIKDTLNFLEHEMKNAQGGYYCALDADSEGVEGKYYTFTMNEWKEILGEDHLASSYFGVVEEGNWESTNILFRKMTLADLSKQYGISLEEVSLKIDAAKEKLFKARQHRVRPQTDDKHLLSWNALMNIALVKCSETLYDTGLLQKAETHMNWMLNTYATGKSLMHTYKSGLARIPALLEDFAYLIKALTELYKKTGTESYMMAAYDYMQTALVELSDDDNLFFYTSSINKEGMPNRKIETYDGVTPSGNAVMAENLIITGMLFGRSEWCARGNEMIKTLATAAKNHPYSFSYWALLARRHYEGYKTVICSGKNAKEMTGEMEKKTGPHIFVFPYHEKTSSLPIFSEKIITNENSILICLENSCLPPVNTIEDAVLLTKRWS